MKQAEGRGGSRAGVGPRPPGVRADPQAIARRLPVLPTEPGPTPGRRRAPAVFSGGPYPTHLGSEVRLGSAHFRGAGGCDGENPGSAGMGLGSSLGSWGGFVSPAPSRPHRAAVRISWRASVPVADAAGLGKSPRICISNKVPGGGCCRCVGPLETVAPRAPSALRCEKSRVAGSPREGLGG